MALWRGRTLLLVSLPIMCLFFLWLQTGFLADVRHASSSSSSSSPNLALKAFVVRTSPDVVRANANTQTSNANTRTNERNSRSPLEGNFRSVSYNKGTANYPLLRPEPIIDSTYASLTRLSPLSSSSVSDASDGTGTKATAAAAKPDPLVLPYDSCISPTGRARVISVCQDWRRFTPASRNIQALRPYLFDDLETPSWSSGEKEDDSSMRTFQFHVLVSRDYLKSRPRQNSDLPTRVFKTIELWWDDPSKTTMLASNNSTSAVKTYKIAVSKFKAWVPEYFEYRYKKKPRYMEFMVRCAFYLPLRVWQSAQAFNVNMRFAVWAAEDVAFYPLDQVIHFPEPRPILAHSLRNTNANHENDHEKSDIARTAPEPHPASPWAQQSPSREQFKNILRADGSKQAHQIAVGAWITKKFSWGDDDDLWLMWTLDVVGVDHVVLLLASRDLDVEGVRKRFQALDAKIAADPYGNGSIRPPKPLSERVTIVKNEALGNETFCYLQDLHVMDIFPRWSVDFDYALLLDADEYLQLFETLPPYRRVDVKTFLSAQNQKHIEGVQGYAYFKRGIAARTKPNKQHDPMVATFLTNLLGCDGRCSSKLLERAAQVWMPLGKSLFSINSTVLPYLHYSPGYSKETWPIAEAFTFHVRQPFDGVTNIHHMLDWWNEQLETWHLDATR